MAELPVPIEIPWRLATTTQKRHGKEPYDSTISLFFYEPKTETLTADYPDERVIFFRLLVSLCPVVVSPSGSSAAKTYLTAVSPVWHALLDLRITPFSASKDTMRPYFHAVAPMSREMIETGVVGNDRSKGQSNRVSVGKSASQLCETSYSSVSTSTEGSGFDIGVLGGSSSSTSSEIFTDRTVNEVIDSTVRDSSTERRELLSHMTNISNVLSLLTTVHVGSPYTRFALWPRPVSYLSLDAGDPNLWYTELLRRRSSGLEGVQEFITVVVAPKGQDFCIEADLKRFFVFDSLPPPPKFDYRFGFTDTLAEALTKANEATDYLYRSSPRGTPLDDLDVALEVDTAKYPRASVDHWNVFFSEQDLANKAIQLAFASPKKFMKDAESLPKVPMPPLARGLVLYKTFDEVYLEAKRAEYEEALSKSPLESGVVSISNTILKTCFENDVEDALTVKSFTEVISDAGMAPFSPTPQPEERHTQSLARRGRAIMTRWNEVQRQFRAHVERTSAWPARSPGLGDERLFEQFMHVVANLDVADARNIALPRLAEKLRLSKATTQKLEQLGCRTFRDLARYLRAAPALEAHAAITAQVDRALRREMGVENCAESVTIFPTLPAHGLDGSARSTLLKAIRNAWSTAEVQ